MCVAKGAPKKPAYGPCNETHGKAGITQGANYITVNSAGSTITAASAYSFNAYNNSTTNTTYKGWTTV